MIKGWRNDPAWVAHYKKRDEERLQRAFDRIKAEHQMQMLNADMERSLRRLKEKPLSVVPW